MTRAADKFAGKIVRHLDYGVEHLDSATCERLAAARRAAVARYRERPAPLYGVAWALNAISQRGGQRVISGGRYLLAAGALILGLIGVVYWQSMSSNEFVEIDVNLLTDDLPINAYLDKGFDSWLKRAPR